MKHTGIIEKLDARTLELKEESDRLKKRVYQLEKILQEFSDSFINLSSKK